MVYSEITGANEPTPPNQHRGCRHRASTQHQQRRRFYCGVDLHARCTHLCILDQSGHGNKKVSGTFFDVIPGKGPDTFVTEPLLLHAERHAPRRRPLVRTF
jgi:hypothetical protein